MSPWNSVAASVGHARRLFEPVQEQRFRKRRRYNRTRATGRPRCTDEHGTALLRSARIYLVTLWCGIGVSTAAAGDLAAHAQDVRDYLDSVVGDIATLRIADTISDLPQPRLPDGRLDPEFAITPAKVELGKLLFHDPLFSSGSLFDETRATASCASCHFVEAGFRAGQVQSIGLGGSGHIDNQGRARRTAIPSLMAIDEDTTPESALDAVDNPGIVSPSINMVAYFEALQWNGSAFQFGTGELPPVERQVRIAFDNHRMNELGFQRVDEYVPMFETAFPEQSWDPPFLIINLFNIVKAISAYERTVVSNQSPWDAFLAGDDYAMTHEQLDGAELFFGKAGCAACHGGPALGSTAFYALGVAEHPTVRPGQYNLGRFDVTHHEDDMYKFRAMTVRQLKNAGPYFHGGSATSLDDVVRYKNDAIPDQSVPTLSTQFVPLGLTDEDIAALVSFLEDALFDPNMARFVPDALPGGRCFPHDDLPARFDTGCADFGDFDDSGVVDLLDFADFQLCSGGDATVGTGDCRYTDRNGDEVVDRVDYSAFNAAFGGR